MIIQSNTKNPTHAVIALHGRGGTAENILTIFADITKENSVKILAPQAQNNTWYPERFLVEQNKNEPWLSASLSVVDEAVTAAMGEGVVHENIVLAGFSQGACLAAEYIKRNPKQYGGGVIMSGGIIGSDTEATTIIRKGSLAGTPIYLGCDNHDFHIPKERVLLTEQVFTQLDAKITCRLYDNLGHTVHPEAIEFLSTLLT